MPSPKKRNLGRQHHLTKRSQSSRKRQKHDVIPRAFTYNHEEHYDNTADIGNLVKSCIHCKCKKWKDETSTFCCANGEVNLPALPEPPQPLQALLTGNEVELNKIRRYNNVLGMTSLGCNEVRENYMPTFKISGQMYHRIGSLLPVSSPKFLQLYFIDDMSVESETRMKYDPTLNINVLKSLQQMLHICNEYVKAFKSTYDKVTQSNQKIEDVKIVIRDVKIPGVHKGRTNKPNEEEIAVVMSGDKFEQRDIIIEGRDNMLKRICETHRSYDPLQYPLLFPYGNDGYHINLKQRSGKRSLSAMQYYRYRLMIRDDNYLLYFRDLLNMYIVDMYIKIESERTLFIKLNQSKLRSEQYAHLRDSMANDSIDDIGKLVILPSTFVGGPRYMCEKTQDGLIYVRKYGTADLFITFTCNPNWREIKETLLPNQKAQHRYDVVARVFKLKLGKLVKMLTKEGVFGQVKCHMYTIEWQKRGLPHAHILLWLHNKIRPNPTLFHVVKDHMIHGPCGRSNPKSPCMENYKCTKRYPRNFINETQCGEDGYPLYKRRSPEQGGQSVELRSITVDNRWVVPYSPLLSHTFNAHINVEACHSIKAIKYICKYICKGSDLATIALNHNEIERYINGRYVSSCEAMWRILAYDIHTHSPSILHLSVHLENGQRVYFTSTTAQQQVDNPPDTTLTAFFKLCSSDHLAKTLLYEEVASYFTWEKKAFRKRKEGCVVDGFPGYCKSNALGRVYTVHPSSRECFYLRMLLFQVRGPTSFASLKMFNGVQYQTYQAACEARGLLENDNQWSETLKEAVLTKHPHNIRHIFSVIVVYCQPSNPRGLYELFKRDMSEDILYDISRQNSINVEFNEDIFNECLIRIENHVSLMSNGKSMADFDLPTPNSDRPRISIEYLREISYNEAELTMYVHNNEPKLYNEQQAVYQAVLKSILNKESKLFYLDAPGGTGKTFVINLLLSKVRSDKKIALAVASSGIAATLLQGGRTVHSTFKAPISTAPNDVCNISKNSGLARLIRECDLIIWDECSMSNKFTLQAIDTTIRDIRGSNKPMGGITLLLAGDFRQTLPVIKRGTRADIVNASLKSSHLWSSVEHLTPLQTNMRLTKDSKLFSNTLLKIGSGTFPNCENKVMINEFAELIPTKEGLIDAVWPDIADLVEKSQQWIVERAILAPLNTTVQEINDLIIEKVASQEIYYYSIVL